MPGSRTQIAQVDVTAGIQLLLGTACGFLIASLYDARVTGLGAAPSSCCRANTEIEGLPLAAALPLTASKRGAYPA
jgi:hypothetical protein